MSVTSTRITKVPKSSINPHDARFIIKKLQKQHEKVSKAGPEGISSFAVASVYNACWCTESETGQWSGHHRASASSQKCKNHRSWPSTSLSSLLPRAVEADQAAESAGKTDDSVVEVEEAETAAGNGDIAQVGDELELSSTSVPVLCVLAIPCALYIDILPVRHTWPASSPPQPSRHPRYPPASSQPRASCTAHTRPRQHCRSNPPAKRGKPPSADARRPRTCEFPRRPGM